MSGRSIRLCRWSMSAVSVVLVVLTMESAQAANEWTSQQADSILMQVSRQLLVHSEADRRPSPQVARDATFETSRATYRAQLVSGQKSVRQIVEAVALSQEFMEWWVTPHMGSGMFGATPGLPPVASPEKAIDNLYCALLGRQVDSRSLAVARKDMVRSGIERVILDLVAGQEYQARFGDTKVPGPSGDPQAGAGCPQVVVMEGRVVGHHH